MLNRCINKDRRAWDEFIRQYEGLVAKSVRYKLSKLRARVPRDQVVDIVQEIFLAIWEKNKLAGVKSPSTLKSWLAMVSLNFTTNYCELRSVRDTGGTLSLDANLFPENPGTTLGCLIPAEKLNTQKTLEANELRAMVDEEISKLDHRQQLVLKFNIFEEKTQKDISEIMDLPEGTVATLIRRGKQRLKDKLKKKIDLVKF